jgi:hypothetical protein
MPKNMTDAITNMKSVLQNLHEGEIEKDILGSRDEVLSKYSMLFSSENIPNLQENDFRQFLMIRNNHHWSGLQRMGPGICQDMSKLRVALLELIDEDTPISERIDSLLPKGKAKVNKLGKAVLTPILLISNPEKYGVWNGTSEGALRKLEIWPKFDKKMSIGKQYVEINNLLLDIANQLNIDLWTLDALWWRIIKFDDSVLNESPQIEEGESEQQFGLERHLHDFLLDNWDKTELGKKWVLAEEGGDIRGYGYERITEIGRIDLLAYRKDEKKWLVIELKRGKTSDKTVGQIMRYMGWVSANLAEKDDSVEGLIIGLLDSEKLRYALKMSNNIRFMRYKVDFQLVPMD